MSVFEACELAVECGLSTMGEAFANVYFHAMSLFLYSDVDEKINRLDEEFSKYDPKALIIDVFPELNK